YKSGSFFMELKISENERYNRIQPPSMKSPMKCSILQRFFNGLITTRLSIRRIGKSMGNRLSCRKKHEANPHPGTKQHSKPRWQTKLRFIVVFAKFNFSEAGKH